jgi:mono/diheme cytochrome c family protein
MTKGICTAAGLLLAILALSNACTKGSQDVLSGGAKCDTVGMTYTADVVPILQNNCYSCHGTGNTAGSGGVLLEGYANLKPYAVNGQLVGNISHAAGYNAMPYGLPKLPDCEINTIVDWVNNGYLNN